MLIIEQKDKVIPPWRDDDATRAMLVFKLFVRKLNLNWCTGQTKQTRRIQSYFTAWLLTPTNFKESLESVIKKTNFKKLTYQ